jgi:hypothetical protein
MRLYIEQVSGDRVPHTGYNLLLNASGQLFFLLRSDGTSW